MMANVSVSVSFGIVTSPHVVTAMPGDTVQWASLEHDELTVSFEARSPFTEKVFRAPGRGQPTRPPAVVRQDNSLIGQDFTCVITLDGQRMENANGVSIRPPK
jgi:plastocyanin